MSWASLVNNDQLRVLLWIQDVTGLLSFSCPLVHVQYSAVLADDWGTFRSTCPIYLQRCLVKCADPKKNNSGPPPHLRLRDKLVCKGGGGVRGLVPLFYFANLISLYFLRGGSETPLPPSRSAHGYWWYPGRLDNISTAGLHSFVYMNSILYYTLSFEKILFNSMLFVSIYCMLVESLSTNILHNRFRA